MGKALPTSAAIQPETCHVVFVKSVRFQVPELDPTQSVLATPVSQGEPSPTPLMQLIPDDAKVVVGHGPLTTKPVAPPTGPLLELPTCPVCLERMDETTGLLTTQCQHVFHCACLSKWKDGSCPVCRFTSNERSNLPGTRNPLRKWKLGGLDDSSEADPDICFSCGAVDNLWVWYVSIPSASLLLLWDIYIFIYKRSKHRAFLLTCFGQPDLRPRRLRAVRRKACL